MKYRNEEKELTMAEHKKNIIRRMSEGFVAWCADTSSAARLERTIAQGVIGVVIGLLSSIAGAPEWAQLCVVPVVMAVLAPIQAEIGKAGE